MKKNPNLRLNSRLLPALSIFLMSLQIYDPSPVWIFLLTGLTGAWLASYLWARSLSRGISFKREMRYEWAQVGDQLEERFTLQNNANFPCLWYEVNDHSNLPGYSASRVSAIGADTTTEWRTQGLCSRRGLFTLGPTDLHTGDPFGFYTIDFHESGSRTLMVMPPIVPLPSIEVAPGGRSGEGRPKVNAPERTVSSGSVREYARGDSLRLVHWLTTARRRELYVRILDGTPTGDWRILLDLDRNVQTGKGWDSTAEHGVILAASLADRGLRLRKAVGLAVNGKQLSWLPSRYSEAHEWAILRALTLVEQGELSLASLLQQLRPQIPARTSLVIITPNTSTHWLEGLLLLIRKGVVPTILLLDPDSFDDSPKSNLSSKTTPRPAIHDVTSTFQAWGLKYYIITKDLLNRPEARPGRRGQWEWRFSPRGRAIPIRQPEPMEWKGLS